MDSSISRQITYLYLFKCNRKIIVKTAEISIYIYTYMRKRQTKKKLEEKKLLNFM